MKTTLDTVVFSTRGQIVIPRRIRRQFEIEKGTRALVYQEGDHIALRPVSPKYIRSLRGSLKGTGAMDVFLAERKREREL